MLAVFGLGAIPWSKVLLPIGISFFSFQSVTYAVDVYRGNTPPMKRVWDYMLYIIMFPQLIAGPIVRYNEIADQITARRRIRWDECLQGFGRFVTGLAKKVLIADVLGRTVDATLGGNIAALDMPSAWIVMVAYTMQLYFDFSGYSDMAIGLGRIIRRTSTSPTTRATSLSSGAAGISPWATSCATTSISLWGATAAASAGCISTSGWYSC